MQIQGEVLFIDSRQITSKKSGRQFTVYSLKLKQDDGELSEKIDCGFDPPKAAKGDYVAATVEKDKNGYLALKSLSAASRPAAAGRTASADKGTDAVGSNDAADRQTQIVLQHSQEMAIKEVELLIANNALPLSAATAKAGTVKRYEEIVQAVEKLTVQRYFDVVTGRLLSRVADAGDVDLAVDGQIPAAGAKPDSDEDD